MSSGMENYNAEKKKKPYFKGLLSLGRDERVRKQMKNTGSIPRLINIKYKEKGFSLSHFCIPHAASEITLFYRGLLVVICVFLAHCMSNCSWFCFVWFFFVKSYCWVFHSLFRTCWEQVKHNKWVLDRALKDIHSVVNSSPLSGSKPHMQALLLRKFCLCANWHPCLLKLSRLLAAHQGPSPRR